MGFLKKIFKKKKKKDSDEIAPVQKRKSQNAVKEPRPAGQSKVQYQSSTPISRASTRYAASQPNSDRKGESEMEPGRILPRNRNYHGMSATEKSRLKSRNASTNDKEIFDSSNAASNGLSHQQLEQLERQQHTHQPTFQMSAEIPRQQLAAMDDMNRSYGSSSSFNLSTDAEDSEYEDLRSRGVLPGSVTNPSALDMSMSAASNPASYTGTDHETVFPALDDLTMPSMTTASKENSRTSALDPARSQQEEMARKLGLMPPPPPPPPRVPSPEEEPGYIPSPSKKSSDPREWAFSPSTQGSNNPASINGVDSNPSSWAISPSTEASNDPLSTRSSTSNHQYFSFDEQPAPMSRSRSTPKAFTSAASRQNPSNARIRQASGAASRHSASPQSHGSSSTGGFGNDFADFADFGNFSSSAAEKADAKPAPTERGELERVFDSYQPSSSRYQPAPPATSPPNQQDRSLSELLALAKNKNRNNGASGNNSGRSGRAQGRTTSSSSVNSAPAYSSSYLRQFHNLGKYNKTGYDRGESNRPVSPRLSNDETSVSDIIESLEMSNQMRSGTVPSNRSVGDTGSSSITRLARERLREKRRKEYEYNSGLRSSDSENSDHEESESWLFDGVAGALGPRGIAADLESLSGRSNRSKNSQGNKSHRSRHSKSRTSSSRKPRTSNESVGSRESRGSRTSRYSHKSTKSFISQMSEQSRSVANDLLRLEMQLAMVGQENRDDLPARSSNSAVGGASSVGGSSRHRSSRKSYSSSQRSTSSASKRSKVTVIAPPGKLGIILANKADAKGTVVSGVRTSSVLVDKVSPGDRIIGIDGEDVSRMTVSEITVIMSRKADYDRNLTILTLPKFTGRREATHGQAALKANDDHQPHHHHTSFESSYQHYRR